MIEFENHDIIIEMTPEGRDGASVTARGVWDENEHYYYLDIVSYNGGSYLAKTDVPTGTLPTNTTYWQVVASNAHWGEITGDLSDQEDLAESLNAKADADAVYTKTEADALLADKADKSSVYTKTEADALLAGKADKSDTYTKAQVDDALYLKADKADSYTKDELDGIFDGIDNALDSKADKDSVYTKTQTNNLLAQKANSADVYTKGETNTLLGAKANTADLGTMAGVNDAPSDGKQYARKNGQWAEVEGGGGGGGGAWGEITGDIDDQTDLQTALDNKAPVILSSASGSIASFADGSPAPVTALSVGIEPVQDLHGYDNPWPAGGGKNLWNIQAYEGVGYNKAVGETVSWTESTATVSGNTISYAIGGWGAKAFRTKPLTAGTYHVHVDISAISSVRMSIYQVDSTDDTIKTKTNYTSGTVIDSNQTVEADGYYLVINIGSNTAQTISFTNYQIEANNAFTSWAPWQNVCPISGHTSAVVTRTGKNLLPDYSHLVDGIGMPVSGGVRVYTDSGNDKGCVIAVKPSTTYYLSGDLSTANTDGKIRTGEFTAYPKNGDTVRNFVTRSSAGAFTTGNSTHWLVVWFTSAISGYSIQLELSSTATAYEAPQIQTVTIDLDGTRYGGTVDVLTGEMRVTMASTVLNTAKIVRDSGTRYHIAKSDIGDVLSANTLSLMNKFKRLQSGEGTSTSGRFFFDTTYLQMNAYQSFATKQEFLDAYGEIQLCYTLATPLTVQLSPSQMQTLLGQNHIWADTGNVAVQYRADTKLFIERLTQPSEDDMTANANIPSGKYFMVGNNLFLSTASIASGETIKPGTNCTALSLADALNNLA